MHKLPNNVSLSLSLSHSLSRLARWVLRLKSTNCNCPLTTSYLQFRTLVGIPSAYINLPVTTHRPCFEASMRSIAVLCFALVAAVLSKSTDAFLVPTGSVGGTKLPASPLIAQQRRPASTQPNDLVVLSAAFFGGGGGNNQNNSDKDQQRAPGGEKISKERRAQLGINADEDEYDLYYALDQNTDPIITKVIAGSFILVMIALLVYAVVIPSLTVCDEGVCR